MRDCWPFYFFYKEKSGQCGKTFPPESVQSASRWQGAVASLTSPKTVCVISTTSQHVLTADLAVPPADFLICTGRKWSLFSGFPSDSKASHISPRFQCLSESLTFYTHCLNLAFIHGISKPGAKSAQLLLEATTAQNSFLSRDFCIPASLTTE